MRAAALGIVLLLGCAAQPCEEEGAQCDCIAERRLPDGTCCLGLTRPDRGVCAARTWARPQPDDAWGEPGAVDVAVAVDSDGRGVAAWVSTAQGQLASEVVVAEERDGAWMLQQPGAALEGFGTRPAIATGPDGEVLVAWKQQLPEPPGSTAPVGDSWLARRRSDGTWVVPVEPLSLPPSGYDPRPLLTPWGEAFVVWNQWSGDSPARSNPGFGVALARRSLGEEADAALARPAAADEVLSPPVANSNEPRIAVGSNGDAVVTWYQAATQTGPLMIYVSERDRVDGVFTQPDADAFVSPPGTDARNPVPAVDPLGNAAVVWVQEDGRGAAPIYLALRDGLGAWSLPDDLDNPFSLARGVASGAQVAFGRDGELFVVWAQGEPGGIASVVIAHRNTEGEWDEPGFDPTVLSSPEHDAIDPSLAVGPHGEVIVVWSERIDGARRKIATRRRNAGATAWSALDVLSADDDDDAEHPVVAIGSTGRAVVAWEQGPQGRARIRFASMD